MNEFWRNDWPTVVAGIGSPHGDDQVGWRLAAALKHRPHVPARVVTVCESTQLLDALPGCRRLIVVDACQSDGVVGSVTRLRWPDPRIAERHNHSTHGVNVCGALRLAEQLGRLPPIVDIFGIEVGNCLPGHDISPSVICSVIKLEAEIRDELREVVHA